MQHPHRRNTRPRAFQCVLGLLLLGTSAIAGAAAPQTELDNGLIHLVLYLPDATNGFYRGTRFDWSGIIGDLRFAGHSYYGPWFSKTDPAVRDYVYSGPDIVAGSASAVTGPSEEFLKEDGSGLGFNEAKAGQTFIKIGVGVLRKPDEQKYSPYRAYEIVDGNKWKVKVHSNSVEFTQKIVDPSSGYGYLYTKTVQLIRGQPRMVIDHTLKNLGRLPIVTNVYDHNFLVLDHQTTGPNFSVILPFTVGLERPIKTELGLVSGSRILYRKQLEDRENFTVHIAGFGKTAEDNDIRIEDTASGTGMRIRGDHALAMEELWSIRSTLAMEPYIALDVAPGATIHWKYSYDYYTLAQK